MKFIKIPSTAPCVMVSFLVVPVLTAAFPHISFTRDHSNATRTAQQSLNLKAGAAFLGIYPAQGQPSGINHVCLGIVNFDAEVF